MCKTPVFTEDFIAQDRNGHKYIVFSPASKYFCVAGVFCGVMCSFKWHEENYYGIETNTDVAEHVEHKP